MYKGWPPAAGSGYGGPKVAKGLHPSGYKEVLVYNVEQLGKIDAKTEAVRIAHRVGKKKRADILAEARRKKIVVLNLRRVREAAGEKPAEEKEEGKTAETEKETEETEGEHEEKKPKPEEKTKKRRRRTEQQ
jgi:large subunit ribosomal protein L32e